jgi:O-antigen ligase
MPSNRASWFLLVGLLAFAPLAFGTVEFWSIAIVEVLALLLALSWIFGGVRQRRIDLRMNASFWSAIGLQVWVALQLLLRLTLDRTSTREGLVLLFCYFLVFLVVSNENWSPRWLRRLAIAMAVIGFAVAMFGMVQFFAWNGSLYWVRPVKFGSPFGPYLNHNHFAGLMEMTFPVALSLAFATRLGIAMRAFIISSGVVMALAAFMTLSRGGLFGLALSFLLFIYLTLRKKVGTRAVLTVGLLVVLGLGGLMWLGAEPAVQRIMALPGLGQELSYVDRIRIAGATLRIIQDHPYTGTGLGTFALLSPMYVSWPTNTLFDKAHNDYLQLLSEVGLIGFSFVVIWIVALFRSLVSMVQDDSQPPSILRIGAFCGCFAILIHSFVDFNLQVPANAIFFATLAGLATRHYRGESPRL